MAPLGSWSGNVLSCMEMVIKVICGESLFRTGAAKVERMLEQFPDVVCRLQIAIYASLTTQQRIIEVRVGFLLYGDVNVGRGEEIKLRVAVCRSANGAKVP